MKANAGDDGASPNWPSQALPAERGSALGRATELLASAASIPRRTRRMKNTKLPASVGRPSVGRRSRARRRGSKRLRPARDGRNSRPRRCRSSGDDLRSSRARGHSPASSSRGRHQAPAGPSRLHCSSNSPADDRWLGRPARELPPHKSNLSIAWQPLLVAAFDRHCLRTASALSR